MRQRPQTTLDTRYVCPLGHVGQHDTDLAGGKGARLGELVRAGFAVPPGFVVTTAAYELALRANGLADRIASQPADDPDGAALREIIAAGPVPAEVSNAVLAAYRTLPCREVAVRSSATTEDTAGATSAGQQDTVLGVGTDEALIEAVARCWASLWTQRAIEYRRHQATGGAAPSMALVVQCMAQAEVAGVMFTANPVTGARDELVLDLGRGLGENLVSGLTTPDHVVIRRRTGQVSEYLPGDRGDGGTPLDGSAGNGSAPAPWLLDHAALRRLAHLGTAIEEHFGEPQDIEWAWAAGDCAVLQARPISALPEHPRKPTRMQRMLAPTVAEMLPVRPYPLDVTTWTGGLFSAAVQLLALAGISPPRLEQICVEEDGVTVRLSPPRLRPTPRVLFAPVRMIFRATRHNPVRWDSDPLLAAALAKAQSLRRLDLGAMSLAELLSTLEETLAVPAMIIELRSRYYPRALLAYIALRALRVSERTAKLVSGLETKTTEVNLALESLATDIRFDPVLRQMFAGRPAQGLLADLERDPRCREFAGKLHAFLERYGHRETVGLGLIASQPTWQSSPETLLSLLQAVAGAPDDSAPPGEGSPESRLAARGIMRLPPLRRAAIGLLTQARRFFQIREDSHFYATLPLPVVHQAVLECGQRLRDAGVIEDPADVWHLRLPELQHAAPSWPPSPERTAELRALVSRRKARRAALAGVPLMNAVPAGNGDASEAVLARGLGSSPGMVTGPARIIHDSSEFGRLRPGDVLVAPYASPSWTPLFRFAAALISDSGSPGSHAAAVAREYGIPAVMGTGDATRKLTDGQLVRVDGGRGVVTPADDQA